MPFLQKFLSIFFILVGIASVLWGFSYWIKPLGFILIGIIFLFYGIKFRFRASMKSLAMRWVSQRMGFFR